MLHCTLCWHLVPLTFGGELFARRHAVKMAVDEFTGVQLSDCDTKYVLWSVLERDQGVWSVTEQICSFFRLDLFLIIIFIKRKCKFDTKATGSSLGCSGVRWRPPRGLFCWDLFGHGWIVVMWSTCCCKGLFTPAKMYIYILGETLDWNVYGWVRLKTDRTCKNPTWIIHSSHLVYPSCARLRTQVDRQLPWLQHGTVSGGSFLPLPSRPLLCLHLFCRDFAFLCKYFLYTVLSILSAILVAIKYKAVCATWNGVWVNFR